ncbi:MAG: EAL domain-containing protein [Kineosporiaceae bacterium]
MPTPPPVPRTAPAPRPEGATDVVLPSQLFAGLGQGFLVLDESGTVLQATSTAADLLASTADALVGRPSPLVPPHARGPLGATRDVRVTPQEQPHADGATGWFTPAEDPASRIADLPSPRASTSPTGIPPVREPIAVRGEAPSRSGTRAVERGTGDGAQRWTYRVALPDGEARRLLITATDLPGGRVLSLVDITDVHAEAPARPRATPRTLGDLSLWECRIADGDFTVSPDLRRALGLRADDHVDVDRWSSWLDPEDRDVVPRLVQEALEGRTSWRLLLRVTPPDGRPRYLRHWCTVSADAAGRPLALVGNVRDVTDGGDAADELRTSRRRLQAAVRLTGLASWSMRVDGSQLWWSDGMYPLFGRDPATFVPTPADHFEVTHPEDLARLLRCIDQVIASGIPDEVDLRVRTAAGVRHLRCWIDVTVDDDLQQTVLGTVLDVTEQARTMRALQAQREEFRLAFHAAPIGMAVLLVDGAGERTVRRVNPELRELLGLPDGELTDAQLVERFPAGARRAHARALRDLCSGAADETDYEVAFHRPDGSEGHLWVRAGIARATSSRPGGRTQVLYHVLDVTQRERDRRDLHQLAMTDPLTGLANRTMFSAGLDEALTGHGDAGAALMLVDLDRFKAVNDTLGHTAGDQLLVEVARRLRQAAPAEALVARLGGDEFAVLLPRRLDPRALRQAAEALRGALAAPHRLGDVEDVSCTATIGAVDLGAGDARPADAYREADLALYAAKAAGRNAVVVADERLRERLHHRRQMERIVRSALDGGRIHVEWQPAVDLATGLVVGHEALARLEDEDGNRLMPEAFLPVAEELNSIGDLDRRITELAVERLAADPHLGYAAVNVAARTLCGGGYADVVRDLLARHDVDPHRLLVELDERSLLGGEGDSPAERTVEALHRLGVRLGLDDFGTGYSALAHLEQFPLDVLKLDHTFVARLGGSPTAQSLVAAIVALAHGYGMVVTAEGVETAEQVQALQRVGCDRAQGWLFDARPGTTPAAVAEAAGAGDVWRTA